MKFIERLRLAEFSKQEKYFLWMLIFFNFFSVLYQISVTKELSASVFAFRSRLHIVFGFATVFYGVGMLAAYKRWYGRLTGGNLAFLGGFTSIFTAASLLAILKLRVNVGPSPYAEPLSSYLPLAGTILLIAVTLVFFGAIFSALIAYFSRNRREYIGAVIAYSQAGVIAAFFSHAVFSVHIGVNGTMALIAASTLFFALSAGKQYLKAPLALTAGALAALWLFPADRNIETLRSADKPIHRRTAYIGLMLSRNDIGNFIPIFDGWSAYSKINLYQVRGTKKIIGAYNYFPTWFYDETPDPYRQRAYRFVRETDSVLCLAMGAGWPVLALSLKHPENITGVEVDPVVVDFFKKNPQYNDGLFNKINVITAEGRNALDELNKKFDAILVDLPGSPATIKENPTEFEDYLFTTEALAKYFSLLTPDGILAYYVLRHQVGGACATLKDNGAYFRTLLFANRPGNIEGDSYLVVVSRNRSRVDAIVQDVLASPVSVDGRKKRIREVSQQFYNSTLPALTDNRPSPFEAIKKDPRMFAGLLKAAKFISVFILILSLAAILAVPRAARDKAGLLYFLLIGAGFILFQFYVYAKFRSCFRDLITTVIYTTAIFSVAGSVGSALTPYIRPLKKRGVNLAVMLLCLAYTYFIFDHIPFGVGNAGLKFLYATLIIAPFGLVGGMFFPLGLLATAPPYLGWALLLDALGAVLGFMVFYLMYWHFGTASTFYPLAACYLFAALLITSLGGNPDSSVGIRRDEV
ncbi:MAG: hypothetical protein KKH28_01980 [Elusimicrobia bacterium]|nr:hypothetical protein [Elusimicrobiota bacterium]